MAAATRIVLGYSKLNAPGVWFQILINDGHGQFGNETDARDLGGPAIVGIVLGVATVALGIALRRRRQAV